MNRKHGVLGTLFALLIAASCAKGQSASNANGGPGGGGGGDADGGSSADGGVSADGAAACPTCDSDGDGVPDGTDQCSDTPAGSAVNKVGCADSQLTPKLEPTFPSYGLTWTPTGDPGRAGGLTWTYTNIDRADLFHIYWIICDDPSTPCGLSLDGPTASPSEAWQLSPADSDFSNGKIVFTNATAIVLADGGAPAISGRLTMTIVDDASAPIPFADVATLGVTARMGQYGAEIKGTGFKVTAIIEVKDASSPWTPYLDYYDAAPTPDTGDAGGNSFMSIGGYFYDK